MRTLRRPSCFVAAAWLWLFGSRERVPCPARCPSAWWFWLCQILRAALGCLGKGILQRGRDGEELSAGVQAELVYSTAFGRPEVRAEPRRHDDVAVVPGRQVEVTLERLEFLRSIPSGCGTCEWSTPPRSRGQGSCLAPVAVRPRQPECWRAFAGTGRGRLGVRAGVGSVSWVALEHRRPERPGRFFVRGAPRRCPASRRSRV